MSEPENEQEQPLSYIERIRARELIQEEVDREELPDVQESSSSS